MAKPSTIERAMAQQSQHAAVPPLWEIKPGMRVRVDWDAHPVCREFQSQRWHGYAGTVVRRTSYIHGDELMNGYWRVQLDPHSPDDGPREVVLPGCALVPLSTPPTL